MKPKSLTQFCLWGGLSLSLNLSAQAQTQPNQTPPVAQKTPSQFVFYLQAETETDPSQVKTVGKYLVPLPQKRLCIQDIPAQKQAEPPTPVCSAPMNLTLESGLTYDTSTSNVYLTAWNPETSPPSKVLSLRELYQVYNSAEVAHLPLKPNLFRERLTLLKENLGTQEETFQLCLAMFSQITGIAEEPLIKTFNLDPTQEDNQTELFKNQGQLCKLLALSGDDPTRSRSPFVTDKPTKPETYKHQLALLALYHLMLRLYDADAAIAHKMAQEKDATPNLITRFKPLNGSGVFQIYETHLLYNHLLKENVNLKSISALMGTIQEFRTSKPLRLATFSQWKAPEIEKLETQLKSLLQKWTPRFNVYASDGVFDKIPDSFQTDLSQAYFDKEYSDFFGGGGKDNLDSSQTRYAFWGTLGLYFQLNQVVNFFDLVMTLERSGDESIPKGNLAFQKLLYWPHYSEYARSPFKPYLSRKLGVLPSADITPGYDFLSSTPKDLSSQIQSATEIAKSPSPASQPPPGTSSHLSVLLSQTFQEVSAHLWSLKTMTQSVERILSLDPKSQTVVELLKQIFNIENPPQDSPKDDPSGKPQTQQSVTPKPPPMKLLERLWIPLSTGLSAQNTAYLKRMISFLFSQTDLSGFLFDNAVLTTAYPSTDPSPDPFSLEEKIQAPKLAYEWTRGLVNRFEIFLRVHAKSLFAKAKDPESINRLKTLVSQLLSETSIKRRLFGCVHDIHLTNPSSIPFTCPIHEAGKAPQLGFKDYPDFENTVKALQTFHNDIAKANSRGESLKPDRVNEGLHARAKLMAGLIIRSQLAGIGLELLPTVARGTELQDREVSDLLNKVRIQTETQLTSNVFSGPDAIPLPPKGSESGMTFVLQLDRIIPLSADNRSPQAPLFFLTRENYYRHLSPRTVLAKISDPKSLATSPDPQKTLISEDVPSLLTGKLQLLPWSHPAQSQEGTVFLGVSGCKGTGLYTCPDVTRSRAIFPDLQTGGLYLDLDTQGPQTREYREKLRTQAVLTNTYVPPGVPSKQTPRKALAHKVLSGTRFAPVERSAVGMPGQTERVYRSDTPSEITEALKAFLTQTSNPRFSMMFQGAFLDKRVVPHLDTPGDLHKWTEALQDHLSEILSGGRADSFPTETWISESFSSGLTRKAVFKTHVLTLPFAQLLSASPNKRSQIQKDLDNIQRTLVTSQSEIQRIAEQALKDQADQKAKIVHKNLNQETAKAIMDTFAESLSPKLETESKKLKKAYDDLNRLLSGEYLRFQVLDEFKDELKNGTFNSLRYFSENTEPPWPEHIAPEQAIHVIMHELEVYQIADISNDGNYSLLRPPKLIQYHRDEPFIRPRLQGQYSYHPGSMHHVWDAWDTPQYTEKATQNKDLRRKKQNLIVYYDGSHTLATQVESGVWFRSEGWNRLGTPLVRGRDQRVALGQDMLDIASRVSKGELKDIPGLSNLVYRIWLTRPHSPPFFNPLADEWAYQQTFATTAGVGSDKRSQFVLELISGLTRVVDKVVNIAGLYTFFGFSDPESPRGRERRVLGALTQSVGADVEPWVQDRSMVLIKEVLANPGGEHYLFAEPGGRTYETIDVALWKHTKQIEIKPVPGSQNFLMVVQQNEPHPKKEWLFNHFFELSYPHHESLSWAFFKFSEEPWEIPGEVQKTPKGQQVYYRATPLCASYAFGVDGTQTGATQFLIDSLLEREAGPISEQTLDKLERTVGPLIMDATPVPRPGTQENPQPKVDWLLSDLMGERQHGGDRLETYTSRLRLGTTRVWDWGTKNQTSKQAQSYPTHTWIPGTCLPLNTQGLVTDMILVE